MLRPDDPRWTSEPGPSLIAVSPDDPSDRMYMQSNLDNVLQWSYNLTSMTLYTAVYDSNGDFVDFTVTENADFPLDSSRRELAIHRPNVDHSQRRLCSAMDYLNAFTSKSFDCSACPFFNERRKSNIPFSRSWYVRGQLSPITFKPCAFRTLQG